MKNNFFSEIPPHNWLIIKCVCTGLFITLFCTIPIYSEEPSGFTHQSLLQEKPSKIISSELKRVKEIGGEVVIDGSLRVLEPGFIKVWDVVEISTPVVAGANHARIFLRADGTKSSLIIGWDDGTYTRIAGN